MTPWPGLIRPHFVKNLNADDEEMINKRVGANVSDVNAFRLLKA